LDPTRGHRSYSKTVKDTVTSYDAMMQSVNEEREAEKERS
jgi:hypothetical protein